jgi:outer membrane protein OmpA-like peptidoglycan-associated protein
MKFRFVFYLILLTFCYNLTFSQKILDSWRLGISLGGSLNLNSLGYQDLSVDKNDFIPIVLIDGYGISPNAGIFYEYKSGSWWGTELRMSYDTRNGVVSDKKDNFESEYELKLSYLNIEPIIKYYNSSMKELSFYGGFQFLFNLGGKYNYKRNKNLDYTESNVTINNLNSFVFGLMGGVAYDIRLSSLKEEYKYYLTPYFETSWIFNQREKTYKDSKQNSIDDIWSTTSFRLGAKLMMDFPNSGTKAGELVSNNNFDVALPEEGDFKVRKVEEHFPLVPHVFFDKTSNEIPKRYILLDKDTASEFNEKTFIDYFKILENPIPQVKIYYNILNIYGDRLRKNPNVAVTLIGSDPYNNQGKELAEKIKSYLMKVFGVKESQIFTEGRQMPRVPSGAINTAPEEKPRADIENRRVEFVFNENDKKLYEPVRFTYLSESNLDNDILLSLSDSTNIKSWSVSFINNQKTQTFGPFEEGSIRIDPAKIMKGINESIFNVQVISLRNNNTTHIDEQEIKLKKIVLPDESKGNRFTITFDYAKTDAVSQYEDVIRENLTPLLTQSKYAYLHGHTDDIGNERANNLLSLKRANETKSLFLKANPLLNPQIQTIGFGEYYMHSYFDNSTPEGRFYNRNVVIDILPIIK